jgi:hypothetical protein
MADGDTSIEATPAASDGGLGTEAEQERLIADHEARHGPLPRRILGELRSAERHGAVAGAKAAGVVGTAGAKAAASVATSAEALTLEIVSTELTGARALAGHVLGMRLLLPAEGVHGPRETAALLYLFGDALAIRPTDDAPMSAIPLLGLHILMPHVAMAHWVYKAGRTAHANMDLAREEQDFKEMLSHWTVDDFREATTALDVHLTAGIPGPVRLYEHLGFVRLAVPRPGGTPIRMKSALPEPSPAYLRMWKLFDSVTWPQGLTMEGPPEPHEPPGAAQVQPSG